MQRWRPPKFPGWEHRSLADAPAGLAVAAYLIPQCLAYARLAGLEPVAGLWAAVPALLVYAVLGTSPLLSIGPESSSAVLVGSTVASLSAGGAAPSADVAAALAMAVAVVAFLGWLFRAGFLADLLSRPVAVGFLAGVAVTMVASQLPRLVGLESSTDAPLGRAVDVARRLGQIRAAPVLVGLAVLAALLVVRRWRALPGPLVILALASAAVALFDLGARRVSTVGAVPSGLPRPGVPGLPVTMWPQVFVSALGVSVVAFSGNIVTARAFARPGAGSMSANRELLAVAGTNAGAGLFGGFPVSSSDSRTALAAAVGGSSQMVSVLAAGCIVAVLVAGGSLVGTIPVPALAGLVVYAAIALVDLAEIRRIVAFRSSEALIMATAFVGVVGFDVLVGIGVAVALSVADLFRRVARAHDAIRAPSLGSPVCTTSTTIRPRGRCPAWSCTATTRRCVSPTPKTSGPGCWPRLRPRRPRSSGWYSTWRPTSRSTSPPWTCSTHCAPNWIVLACSSRSRGSNTISPSTWSGPGSPRGWAPIGSTRRCPPHWPHSTSGEKENGRRLLSRPKA